MHSLLHTDTKLHSSAAWLSITTKQKLIYPVAKTIGLLFLEVFRHDLSYSKVHSDTDTVFASKAQKILLITGK